MNSWSDYCSFSFLFYLFWIHRKVWNLIKVHVRRGDTYSFSKHSKPVMTLAYLFASCVWIAHVWWIDILRAQICYCFLKLEVASCLYYFLGAKSVKIKIANFKSTAYMICFYAPYLLVLRQTNAFILLSVVYMSILPQIRTCLSRYFAHGTATDFMYDVVRVPLAYTFEIYGDGTASSRDCFKMFNPTDLASYDTVLNDWSAAFFTIFKLAPHQLGEIQSKASVFKLDKLVSIDEYLDGYLMERRNRYGKKMEVLELGMQEIRTYYRLFLLSSVLLLCMFCSRISKTKSRPIVSAMSL